MLPTKPTLPSLTKSKTQDKTKLGLPLFFALRRFVLFFAFSFYKNNMEASCKAQRSMICFVNNVGALCGVSVSAGERLVHKIFSPITSFLPARFSLRCPISMRTWQALSIHRRILVTMPLLLLIAPFVSVLRCPGVEYGVFLGVHAFPGHSALEEEPPTPVCRVSLVLFCQCGFLIVLSLTVYVATQRPLLMMLGCCGCAHRVVSCIPSQPSLRMGRHERLPLPACLSLAHGIWGVCLDPWPFPDNGATLAAPDLGGAGEVVRASQRSMHAVCCVRPSPPPAGT